MVVQAPGNTHTLFPAGRYKGSQITSASFPRAIRTVPWKEAATLDGLPDGHIPNELTTKEQAELMARKIA